MRACCDDPDAIAHRLLDLVVAMAACRDHASALELCRRAAMEVAGAEDARIYALEWTGTELVVPGGGEPPIPLYIGGKPNLAEPRAWSACTGEPAVVPDARHAGTWDCTLILARDAAERRATHSLLVCPLRAEDRTVGVLEVSGLLDADGAPLGPEALRARVPHLSAIAFQAAALTSSLTLEARNRELAERLARLDPKREDGVAGDGQRAARLTLALRESGVIAASRAMAPAIELIGKVADSPVPVLLLGETGTGKEVAARLIHAASARHAQPFVAQNCAALPADLLESELFGYRRGAFTGATADKPGLFELAEKGTLFLDEIGDMPLALQAKLLRVLQDGEVRALGATRGRRLDVRILSATHNDLARAVAEGRFREDLYYRLSVFPVTLPPLRDRAEDILPMARAFLFSAAERFGRRVEGLSPAAERRIAAFAWPGNVRELRNAMERAAILCPTGEAVRPEHLPPALCTDAPAQPADAGDLRDAVARTEREAILRALLACSGNVSRAAKALGLSRRTLHEKLARHGLDRDARRVSAPA